MKKICLAIALTVIGTGLAHAADAPSLKTVAELSGWKQTGRYDETTLLCHSYAEAFSGKVRCYSYGQTPEGRPMMALAISGDGMLTAQAARAAGRPVIVFQGGIHAGEIDGKDAGFAFIRELLEGKPSELDPGEEAGLFNRRAREILMHSVVVFVPVFNGDGHERFGRWNRPNQIGPEEMGWRTTAQNLNLNRDYAKAEAPEMQAMLKLLGEWDPILYVDLHVTDGAQFQPDVSVIVAPSEVGPKELMSDGRMLRGDAMQYLKSRGSLPNDFYPSFLTDDDPSTGFERSLSPPRFSQSYWSYRNRLGVLVETHSWKDYRRRCKATLDTLRVLVGSAAAHGQKWLKAAHLADEDGKRRGGQDVPLTWEHTPEATPIDFPGYAYTREVSPVSGRKETLYDPTKPEVWHLPLYEHLKPKLSVRAPKAGYVVPGAYAGLLEEKLRLHGIRFERLLFLHPDLEVEAYRATEAGFGKAPYEGRQALTLKGSWAPEKQSVRPGALFVPIDQPLSELVMELLEPEAPDSYASWGFFNSSFELKEYMENYVADAIGREALDPANAKTAGIREEFNHRLETDPEFAKDPDQRLGFFYRRSPSWDTRYNLYPIYRVNKPLKERDS